MVLCGSNLRILIRSEIKIEKRSFMTRSFAVVIFVLVYAVILAGEKSPRKLDRPSAGLIGAVLMVLCGVLSRTEAFQAVDLATLALLLGMMIVIHYATSSGLLDHLAHALIARSHSAKQLLWIVCACAGLLSALFLNDTICLLMTPMLLTLCRRAKLPPEPYLIALATSSNVGSVMTLTGNPQNILVGQSSHWTWGAFALRMVPIGLICLIINALVVGFVYRKPLREAQWGANGDDSEEPQPLQRVLAGKTLFVLAGLLVAFLCGVPMEIAALAAGAVMLVLANRPAEETLEAVDWSLLLFFAGLFVVVAGITKTEAGLITRSIPALTQQPGSFRELTKFSLASVLGSNLFSNVPFVMLVRGFVIQLPRAPLLWLTLAASSTFAGNLTLVGSVANLIVAQKARQECPLSFWAFLKVGVISTILTTLASILLLWLFGRWHWA
jgi:Na+/H+ antiporter NhaD/arsenite permease-like protein